MALKVFFSSLLCIFFASSSSLGVSTHPLSTLDDFSNESFRVVLINYTPTTILLRLRYGPIGDDRKNPIPPLGFIKAMDKNSILPENDQVVKIKNGQAVSFETNMTEFPYRIRIWRENYIPDLDLDTDGTPLKTSKANAKNSLVGVEIAHFEFDYETLTHTFAITQREDKFNIYQILYPISCNFINCSKGHYINNNNI